MKLIYRTYLYIIYNPMTPQEFEEQIQADLHRFLLSRDAVDERLPECPDVALKWAEIGEAYLPDGMREFQDYPAVSLGWVMFIGMAVARLWDKDWQTYGAQDDLYERLRDTRGYDAMDEYLLEEIIHVGPKAAAELSALVGDCAARTNNALLRAGFEPGTAEAFRAYVAALHQMYLMGMAVQLKRMGYRMTLQEL